MNLVPWKGKKPSDFVHGPLASFKVEMDRLFDDFSKWHLLKKGPEIFSPSVEISETKSSYSVKAEIPGIDKKDLKVSVSNHFVTIKGEKKQSRENKGKNIYYKETRYGSFYRQMPFESEIDKSRVRTTFKNGVLELVLPKRRSGKSGSVDIKVK
ncbi:MAG: Hsp20/alpha crystallin family protein [Candidatus Omnitrophica bacterium]|nr:Hsp20/alpha crystallin family protein [Candidatus Omnitrophota bacterium]